MKCRCVVVCTLYMYKIDFQIHPTLIDIYTNVLSSAVLFTRPCGFTSSVRPSTVPLGQYMLVTTNKTESRPFHISCDVFLMQFIMGCILGLLQHDAAQGQTIILSNVWVQFVHWCLIGLNVKCFNICLTLFGLIW